MKFNKLLSAAISTALITGCGGGGSSNSSTPANPPATTYNFVAPKINSQRNYAKTIVDDSNNTINETAQETITNVNADGSFVVAQVDPNHNAITVNGTTYSVPTETINVDNSGRDTSYTLTEAGDDSPTTCIYAPHALVPTIRLWSAILGHRATQ